MAWLTQDLEEPARTWLGVQEVGAGTRLLNRYTVREVIAPANDGEEAIYALEGGDGTPLMAQDVKVAAESEETFTDLSKRAADLNHANLVRLVETVTVAPHHFVLLERVDAVPLDQRFPAGREISQKLLLHLTEQICELFGYLQEQGYLLDRADAARVWITPDDTLRLVSFRLQRETVGETVLPDHFRAASELLGFLVARRKPDHRLALLLERCKGYEATPAFSFYELKLGLRQVLSPVRTALAGRSLLGHIYSRLASTKPQHMLAVITAVVLLSQVHLTTTPQQIVRGGPGAVSSALACLLSGHDTLITVDQTVLRVTGSRTMPGADLRGLCEIGDGRYLVMSDTASTSLRIFDTQTGTEGMPIKLFAPPTQVFSPDHERVYCQLPSRHMLVELHGSPLQVTHAVALRGDPRNFTVSSDNRFLYYSDNGGLVRCHDLRASVDKGAVAVTRPGGLAVSPDGHQLWVAQPELDSVSVIDLTHAGPALTHQASANPLDSAGGTHPTSVTFSGDGRYVVVMCQGTNSISVFSAADKQLMGTVNTGGHPAAMHWASLDSSQLWVANDDSRTVSIIAVDALKVLQKLNVAPATALEMLPALSRATAGSSASPSASP